MLPLGKFPIIPFLFLLFFSVPSFFMSNQFPMIDLVLILEPVRRFIFFAVELLLVVLFYGGQTVSFIVIMFLPTVSRIVVGVTLLRSSIVLRKLTHKLGFINLLKMQQFIVSFRKTTG